MADEERPAWRDDMTNALVGCTVLVGRTVLRASGEPAGHEQLFGLVESAGPEGVTIRLRGRRGGERLWLPPDPRAFEPADPGTYRLKSTGEEVVDPDYLSTWTVSLPD